MIKRANDTERMRELRLELARLEREQRPAPIKRVPVTFRMPRSLHNRIARAATASGKSMNSYIVDCIEKNIAWEERK